MRILWAILAAVMLTSEAQAGTLTVIDSPHCSARFEGQIVKGDYALFQDMIPRLKQAERKEYEFGNAGICLNSPGGSMLEATKIATYLEDQRIGTVIDDGDTCLSACSIMFMLGAVDEASTLNTEITGNRILLEFDRKMHMNATLGFHRPDLKLQEQSGFTSQDMEKSFDIAVLSVLEFVRVANNWKQKEGTTAIAPDLLQEMLQHEGQDFFYIDTVDKAGRWKIDVFGYQTPRKTSAREALNSCDNLSNWVSGLAPVPVAGADIETLKRLTSNYSIWYLSDEQIPYSYPMYSIWGRDQFYHAGEDSGERYCQIRINLQDPDKWPATVDGCGGDSVLGQSFFEWCSADQRSPVLDFFEALPMFPSDLPLRDLERFSRQIEAEADDIAAALIQQPTLACAKGENDRVSVAAPSGTVPVFAEADPASTRVATLRNYVEVDRGDSPGRLYGSTETQQSCFDACNALADDPATHSTASSPVAQTIQSCFDNDAIWWSVTLRDGTTGYASAKYLR